MRKLSVDSDGRYAPQKQTSVMLPVASATKSSATWKAPRSDEEALTSEKSWQVPVAPVASALAGQAVGGGQLA